MILDIILRKFFRGTFLKKNRLMISDNIATQTTAQERDFLFYIARKKMGGTAVEIGSAFGASSCFLAAGLGKEGRLYCVDRWNVEYRNEGGLIKNYLYESDGRLTEYVWSETGKEISYIDRGHFREECPTYTEFLKNIEPYKNWVTAIRMESIEASKIVSGPLDILFLDGWHEYDQVSLDCKSWLPKLAPEGYVIFHDYGWAKGVQKVIEETIIPIAKRSGRFPNMFWAQLK